MLTFLTILSAGFHRLAAFVGSSERMRIRDSRVSVKPHRRAVRLRPWWTAVSVGWHLRAPAMAEGARRLTDSPSHCASLRTAALVSAVKARRSCSSASRITGWEPGDSSTSDFSYLSSFSFSGTWTPFNPVTVRSIICEYGHRRPAWVAGGWGLRSLLGYPGPALLSLPAPASPHLACPLGPSPQAPRQ